MTAQDLLRTDQAVRDAFAECYKGKYTRTLEEFVSSLTPIVWKSFVRSPQGKAIATTGYGFEAYHVAATPPNTPAPATAAPQLTTGICDACKCTLPIAWLEGQYCKNCIATVIKRDTPAPATAPRSTVILSSLLCEQCHTPMPQGDIDAGHVRCVQCVYGGKTDVPNIFVDTPAAAPAIVKPAEPAISTAEQGLLGMLAEGLKSIGFSPDKAVTAQRCEEIAFEQAHAVVEMVLEDLEKQGKLGSKKQVLELRQPSQPVRTLEGYTPSWFPRLVKLHDCGIPAFLVGPAGSGKTTAFAKLAELMGKPFYRLSMTAGIDEGNLQGWLHPKKQMNFEYVASMISEGFEAPNGCVVLLDDIDLADPNMLGIANAIFDNGGWYIPLRHENPKFIRSEKFYIGAAANSYGHGADRQYVGANQLDERTLSRLRAGQIRCDYDQVLETNLFGNHKDHAAESLVFGHRLRARLRALPGQQRDVSTRDIESRYKMLDQFTVAEAWYGQFADWSPDECSRVHAHVDHAAMTVELE